MTLQELIKNGILDELAEVFQDAANARILLEAIGYPRRGRPTFPADGDVLDYWTTVCSQIESGILHDSTDLQPLVDAAATRYPTNQIFQRYRSGNAAQHEAPESNAGTETPVRQGPFVYVLVQGTQNVETLIDRARTLAVELRMPSNSVSLEIANPEGILLGLADWTTTQAVPFANRLRDQANGQAINASVTSSNFRDYLIRQLFVEGPDQARFEINDIRASTPIRDVAQGVISTEYDPKVFGQDAKGRGREVVIDREFPDGSTQRLDPDKTLHDHGIQEGDTLSVSPESTAGAVNPIIREEALARVREQVLRYAGSHRGFQVSANSQYAPTEYTFRFRAPSFAPPATVGAEPPWIDEHEVFLLLPPDFPMHAPLVFWQTEIFHPNIDPKYGAVCLGPLGDHYQPGLDFGDLCQMLVDMASYNNYVVEEGYNLEAQQWAKSLEGQVAIERRGGQSVLRKFVHQHYQPRPLSIRRIQQ